MRLFGYIIFERANRQPDPRMLDEKAREYQEVAALVCEDLEVLLDVLENNPDMTAEQIRTQVASTVQMKNDTISNHQERRRRYASMCCLYSLGVERSA